MFRSGQHSIVGDRRPTKEVKENKPWSRQKQSSWGRRDVASARCAECGEEGGRHSEDVQGVHARQVLQCLVPTKALADA
jgi:hypothetical protein